MEQLAPTAGRHPLDDEHVTVTVSLTHRTTLTTAVSSRTTEADDEETVREMVSQATEEAMDDLLRQLEERG